LLFAPPTPLPGEDCANAIAIPILPFCDQGSTANFANDFDNDCVFTPGGKDVAYSFTPDRDMVVSLSTCGTSFYSTVSVWVGCFAAPPQQYACNYGGCVGERGSCLTNVSLSAGTTYYFVVDSEDNRLGNPEDEGPYDFAVQEGTVCPDCDEILPVELLSFTASGQNRQVTLHWSTASEHNSDHFEIVRNGIVREIISAAGESATTRNYTWIDREVQNDLTYSYTLVGVDLTGAHETLGSVDATPAFDAYAVTEYALHQNYPNPFNPTTTITVDLKEAGFVSLRVYNLLGQEVRSLINESLPRGSHMALFDAAHLPSGVYVYKLEVNDFSAQRKMVLMK